MFINIINFGGSVKLSGKKKSRRSMGKIITKEEEEICYNWLIKNVGDNNEISRYTFEGVLLYVLEIPYLKVYNVVMNLSDKGILKLFSKSDGDYYLFIEKRS